MRRKQIVRRVAHIDAEDIGARLEQRRHHRRACWKPGPSVATILVLRWRLMAAFSSRISWKGFASSRAICRYRLRKSRAGRNRGRRNRRARGPGISSPGAVQKWVLPSQTPAGAVGGIKIIITRLQRPGEKAGAGLGRHRPPALAGPIGAVEAAQRHPRRQIALVADIEGGQGRRAA